MPAPKDAWLCLKPLGPSLREAPPPGSNANVVIALHVCPLSLACTPHHACVPCHVCTLCHMCALGHVCMVCTVLHVCALCHVCASHHVCVPCNMCSVYHVCTESYVHCIIYSSLSQAGPEAVPSRYPHPISLCFKEDSSTFPSLPQLGKDEDHCWLLKALKVF